MQVADTTNDLSSYWNASSLVRDIGQLSRREETARRVRYRRGLNSDLAPYTQRTRSGSNV